MVTTQFTWPYGGHNVFLTGTFTRWTDHALMTLMEGSSSIFLAFRNLDPGYHQYRFLVDGVWRVDDKQPCVTDETGVINNVVYVKEYEQQPSSSASSMEVDNAVSSGRMHGDLGLQISDGEIELFRRRFSMLLSGCTAYDLLPQSGKVSVLDITVAVKQAFHVMYEQGLIGAPLWDEARGQYRGMLTASDFILILAELHRNGSVLSNEELETHSISAWKEAKYRLNGGHDMPVNPPYERVLIQAGPSESLKDVALKLLRNKISTIPIIHQAQESSSPQLLHLACLSGILKYICRYFRHSPGSLLLLQKPIGRLPIGTWVPEIGKAAKSHLTTLQATAPLSSALTLLMEAQVSSLPIVDGNGSLLDVYSRGDITSLAKDNAYASIPLDQTSMHQALQLRFEANGAIYSHRQCITCLRSESLHEVLERLSDPAVRRLIFVEPGSKRVEGIISISDIFHFIMGR